MGCVARGDLPNLVGDAGPMGWLNVAFEQTVYALFFLW